MPLDPKDRAVVTVKDLNEQMKKNGHPEVDKVLVYGSGANWIAIRSFKIYSAVLYAETALGGEIVFPINRPWTIYPMSILTMRTLGTYKEDAMRDQASAKSLFGDMQTLEIDEGDMPVQASMPKGVSTGQYL